jgi:hypothetical protein
VLDRSSRVIRRCGIVARSILSRLQRDSFLQLAGLLALIVLVVLAGSLLVLRSGLKTSDRLTGLADVLAAGTFVLAAFAGIVAIAAYRLSARRPQLAIDLDIGCSSSPFLFVIDDQVEAPEGFWALSEAAKMPDMFIPNSCDNMLTARPRLRNSADYTARNPAVRIEFLGLSRIPSGQADWVRLADNLVLWEGRADYAIHGSFTRELSPLKLAGLIAEKPVPGWKGFKLAHHIGSGMIVPLQHAVVIEIVAEGFHDVRTVEAKVLTRAEWFSFWQEFSSGSRSPA